MKVRTKAISTVMAVITVAGIGLNLGMRVYAYERASVIDKELATVINCTDLEEEKLSTVVVIDDIDLTQHTNIQELRELILSAENHMTDDEIQNAISCFLRYSVF